LNFIIAFSYFFVSIFFHYFYATNFHYIFLFCGNNITKINRMQEKKNSISTKGMPFLGIPLSSQ